MSNVSALPGATVPTGEPDTSMVKLLRGVLKMAESGELRSIVMTGFVASGDCMSGFAGDLDSDVYKMRGAIMWLDTEYTDRVLGNAKD